VTALPQVDALVTGAGGFIGGHLVARLLAEGRTVRAVDLKPLDEWYQSFDDAHNLCRDLALKDSCAEVVPAAREIYALAADMGGMGFIAHHKAECMLSVLITTHLLQAAVASRPERFFFASSACVYAAGHQADSAVVPLVEADAYPAMPEDGYGWEKLFSERMAWHFCEDFGLPTRVARYHNVYGPNGSWDDGREKAPAAICRKVAEAVLSRRHEIDVWGDGEQTRSFTYIDDCLTGTLLVTRGESPEPVNVGSAELVTINELVDIVAGIAGVELERHHDLSAPQGVRGRNSDNTLVRARYGWEPSVALRDGLAVTYRWVFDQVAARHHVRV